MNRTLHDSLCDDCYIKIIEEYHRKLDEQLSQLTHNEDLIEEFMEYQYDTTGFLNFYYQVSDDNGTLDTDKLQKEFNRYLTEERE